MAQFLEGVDGSTTAVIIAKDLCSNLDTSKSVTEGVKYGIDLLLSQILQYYKTMYQPSDPISLSTSPPPLLPNQPPPPPSSVSPSPTMHMSASYSSFYSYTRNYSPFEGKQPAEAFDFPNSRSVDPELSQTPRETPSSSWTSFFSSLFSFRSTTSIQRSSTSALTPSQLPPSLRSLPLYLYYLRRGCLFGDCFHNQDLLQLRRLQIASASLQDALRIILPRLILARDDAPTLLQHSHSHISSPPPTHAPRGSNLSSGSIGSIGSMGSLGSSAMSRGHRRGNSRLSSVASLLSSRAASMPDLLNISSEVVVEGRKPEMRRKETKKREGECVEIKKKDDDACNYIAFVAEEEGAGSEYFLPTEWLQFTPSSSQPRYSILSPESLTLLSDSVVVLDTEREIFIWVGNERDGTKDDSVLSHCLSVALSITQERNPPSVIRVVREYSSNSRYVLCNLIPSHKDPKDIAMQSLRVLTEYPAQFLKEHVGKFLYTDDMSFREYMTMIYHFRWNCLLNKNKE